MAALAGGSTGTVTDWKPIYDEILCSEKFAVPLAAGFDAPYCDERLPFHEVSVPARISKAIGKKGPIPVIAKISGLMDLLVSLVPVGGGRHRLRLNPPWGYNHRLPSLQRRRRSAH
ncbi:MAG TPA: hypothetical protein DCQ33_06755 [Nitrospira sp.]|nr:hypothetical protein [Nitrospira sp.]